MSPEALIGMEVGKGVLQRLLGQGTMGTVYLATQAQRQVAIKIFFPASQLAPTDYEAFRQRLAQVIAQSARLDHAHILSVLDYGEHSGFLYQVTPYILGESLQQLLARSGPLPFTQIQNYLEQLAAALDYAHASGILHRDIKPENILLTPDGDALLADFGLAGLTTEKNFARARRATPNMLDTIAPEYVLNTPANEYADLYSLGVVLYYMVTGKVPFQSASIVEVAMQHVKATPPAPNALRSDLPQAAAQVILRALAKAPTERYACAQELASAFRLALSTEQAPATPHTLVSETLVPRSGGLFDPKWQALTPVQLSIKTPVVAPSEPSTTPDKSLRRPGRLHLANLQINAFDASVAQEQSQAVPSYVNLRTPSDQLGFNQPTGHHTGTLLEQTTQSQDSPLPSNAQTTNTSTFSEPVQTSDILVQRSSLIADLRYDQGSKKLGTAKKRMQAISLILVALIVTVGSGIFWSTHNSSSYQAQINATPHVSVTARIQTTAHTNLLLSDDLSQNTRNWVVGSQGSFHYIFKDGAYLIANADKVNSAPALLPNKVFSAPFAYSLTMEQLQGDLSSPNNQFGMLLDTTNLNINGKQVETFYAFEVVNKPGGQYQFWKYDSGKNSAKPWTLLWSNNFGKEFLQGSGPDHINTLKVMDTGKNFTFMVNGTQVGMWQDGSFTSGSIGMLVNLNGAEVAFSHLLVTSM